MYSIKRHVVYPFSLLYILKHFLKETHKKIKRHGLTVVKKRTE